MALAQVGDKIKTSVAYGWQSVATGYNSTVLPTVRVAFTALSRYIGPIGAHLTLGAAAIGLFYLGHSLWTMKMTWVEKDAENREVVKRKGPQNRFVQLLIRMAGLFQIALSALIAGGLIAIGTGSTAAAIGVTGGIALVGVLV